jgi:hypothetical protein
MTRCHFPTLRAEPPTTADVFLPVGALWYQVENSGSLRKLVFTLRRLSRLQYAHAMRWHLQHLGGAEGQPGCREQQPFGTFDPQVCTS